MAKKARKPTKKTRRSTAPKSKKAKKTSKGRRAKRAVAAKSRPRRPVRRAGSKAAKRPAIRRSARSPKGSASSTKPSAGSGVKRSTRSPAGAGASRRVPSLERERRRLRDVEENVPQPPSSLNLDRHGSAARSGRAALEQARHNHTETSPAMTGGDVDADWEDAYAVGDEAPGGDNPTPDQDRVDDIGRALGIEYADNEELKASDKISARDKHRWELDPASAEDYPDHEE
jgi:uncharacterized protein DUF6335